MATSPLPSRGPKSGRNCYITPAFLGVSTIGDKIGSRYITPAFSGVPTVGRHEQETKRCLFSMQEW